MNWKSYNQNITHEISAAWYVPITYIAVEWTCGTKHTTLMQIEWLNGVYNNNEYFLFDQADKIEIK